ncbi:hypothetical protein Sste5346_005162 [Sporothrix stenoceras]|uniref:Translin-associated protein X n=1 Tax=Sporothrix stenoceras TaxID=5173 RepID=A0ABR3Z5Y3_9PEZI
MAPEGKRRWQADSNGGPSDSPDHKKMARRGPPPPMTPAVRNAYTPMFEKFRDHLDAHHDRRERVVKASRDITALSKKIIFALQRVRRIHPDLPKDVDGEVNKKLAEIGKLLAGIAPEMQGINRGRYARVLFGMEELLEALTFLNYLKFQTLLSPEDAAEQVAALCVQGRADTVDEKDVLFIHPDDNEFLMGVFDLSGEMMRFATTSAALRGELASDGDDKAGRSIVGDMQELDSFFRMLPRRHDKSWKMKTQTLQSSVQKVERLGYDLRVRGSERPKGWIPDAPEANEGGSP